MTNRLLLVFASLFFISLSAFAEGKLGFSIKTDDGFWRVDVLENAGMREGVWTIGGGRYALKAYKSDGRFHLPLAQNTNDGLIFEDYDQTHTYYHGLLWFSNITSIDTYRDMKKGTIRLKGEVGENATFDYHSDVNKKGKKTFYLFFKTKSDGEEISLEGTLTPEKAEGSCTGRLRVNTSEVGRFNCTSSGKLKDSFFWSDEDVIAWLVHLFVVPDDNGSSLLNTLNHK